MSSLPSLVGRAAARRATELRVARFVVGAGRAGAADVAVRVHARYSQAYVLTGS